MISRRLTVNNVLFHEALSLDIPTGPVLITGENSSGKSSVAKILAALTTHQTNPAGLSAALSKTYIRKGAVEGTASLSDGPTWIVPGKMEIPAGCEPETGPHMVNMVDFIGSPGRPADERAKLYESLFLPDDPESLLRPAWKQSEQQLNAALKLIRSNKGWKGALAIYEEQRRDAGRKWGDVTGQRYTKKRGPQWKPADWEVDLEGLSEDDVLAAFTEAQDVLRAAGVRQAVDQDRVDRGVEARDTKLPAQLELVANLKDSAERLRAELKPLNDLGLSARTTFTSAKDSLEKAEAQLAALEAPAPWSGRAPLECPDCGAHLDTVDNNGARELVDWKPPPNPVIVTSEKSVLENKITVYTTNRDTALVAFKKHGAAYEAKRGAADEATAAYNQALGLLKEYRGQAKDADLKVGESNDAERSALENARDRADARRKAWLSNRDAQRAHENYVEYDAIAALLGPTGVRAQHMKGHMDTVRKALLNISTKAGWLPITITDAYEPVTGGYPAALTSDNEKKKVQWAVQAALVLINPAARWVIFDAADLLRGRHWDGLCRLVDALTAKRKDLHVIVCATLTECPEGWHQIELPDPA